MTDKLTEVYDQRYSGGYRKNLVGYEIARWAALEHFIKRVLKINNIRTVLDYGAGRGLHVELWRKVFPKANLYFCDISSVALKKLVEDYPEYESNCVQIKNDYMPFPDTSFDIVISVEVMEHVANLDSYLNDIHRLLKPEGTFIWTTPCGNRFSIEHIFNVLTKQVEETNEGYRRWKWEDPTHLRRLTSKEILGKLEKHGFDKIIFRFRSHFFSFVCTALMRGPLSRLGERMMLLDYFLFRMFPNGASMIGAARKRSA
jgi:ubiquinone/menaquinone biosynthesis C-methylase UbiE